MFKKAERKPDWEKYFGLDVLPKTEKQRLIDECENRGIPIGINDSSEGSHMFQTIASSAELWMRLQTSNAKTAASKANWISSVAVLISLAALIVSIVK